MRSAWNLLPLRCRVVTPGGEPSPTKLTAWIPNLVVAQLAVLALMQIGVVHYQTVMVVKIMMVQLKVEGCGQRQRQSAALP